MIYDVRLVDIPIQNKKKLFDRKLKQKKENLFVLIQLKNFRGST
jgi:hypothetical protein